MIAPHAKIILADAALKTLDTNRVRSGCGNEPQKRALSTTMVEVTTSEESAKRPGFQRRVAIIGGGPGGLVAARYLKDHGFEPVIFEQGDEIGGQWNVRSLHSGVWPSMVTNTSRFLTCFSDLAPEPGSPIFPSNHEILAYLKRYAQRFDIDSHIRYRTRVELIERNPIGEGWVIQSSAAQPRTELFRYVVVASGRFNKPLIPLFGPLSAISFRLSGPDCLPNAGERITAEAQALGTIVSSTFSSEEVAQLRALAAARKDPNFRNLWTESRIFSRADYGDFDAVFGT